MKRFSLAELENMETISQGQFDNLKFQSETTRVWLSRCTVADGEPYNNKTTVEKYINGRWQIVDTYQALYRDY